MHYSIEEFNDEPLRNMLIMKKKTTQFSIVKNMIIVIYNYMGPNFASTLLTVGRVGLAAYYEQLSNLYDGVH